MKAQINRFLLTIIFCIFLSFILTLVYYKLPPFYVTSYNFAIVFDLEKNDKNYTYNGFYQSQLNNEIVKNLALFSAGSDFKTKLSKEVNANILYMLSKTNGTSIVTIQLVTLKKLDEKEVLKKIKNNLEKTLQATTPKGLVYKINSMDDYNQTYNNRISPSKFFVVSFSIILILYSLLLLLKGFIYGRD